MGVTGFSAPKGAQGPMARDLDLLEAAGAKADWMLQTFPGFLSMDIGAGRLAAFDRAVEADASSAATGGL